MKALKLFAKAAGYAAAAVFAALLALTVYIMVCNMQGKAVNIAGYYTLKVVTGSMEPSIHTGDYIIVKETDCDKLKVGDIISFYSEDESIYGMLNTHRIAKINSDGSFVTKGDANSEADSVTVKKDKVIGRYEGKIRVLRWVNSFASGRKLLMLLVIIPMLGVSLYEVITIARLRAECAEKSEQAEQEEKQRLIREAIDKEKQRLYRENNSSEVKLDEEGQDKDKH